MPSFARLCWNVVSGRWDGPDAIQHMTVLAGAMGNLVRTIAVDDYIDIRGLAWASETSKRVRHAILIIVCWPSGVVVTR